MPSMGIKAECTKRLRSKGTCCKKKLLNAKYDTIKDFISLKSTCKFQFIKSKSLMDRPKNNNP